MKTIWCWLIMLGALWTLLGPLPVAAAGTSAPQPPAPSYHVQLTARTIDQQAAPGVPFSLVPIHAAGTQAVAAADARTYTVLGPAQRQVADAAGLVQWQLPAGDYVVTQERSPQYQATLKPFLISLPAMAQGSQLTITAKPIRTVPAEPTTPPVSPSPAAPAIPGSTGAGQPPVSPAVGTKPILQTAASVTPPWPLVIIGGLLLAGLIGRGFVLHDIRRRRSVDQN